MTAKAEASANAVTLAWRDCGRGGGAPLVLLHGFGGSGHSFDPLLGDIEAHARAILIDLPGHGASFDAGGSRHPRAAAAAVLATLDAIGCEDFHLGGFSMGGAVACLVAMQAPDRVRSLTLLAPGGFGSEIAAATLRRFAAARSEAEIRAALCDMVAPGTEPPQAEVEALQAERRNDALVPELTAVAELITRDGKQGEIPRSALAEIACPVRIVWGTADPVLPVTQSDGLPPRFALRLVEGAGHMLVHEARQAVAETFMAAVSESD